MAAPKVERVSKTLSLLGEAPHWVARERALYYTDIPGSRVLKYVPSTEQESNVDMGGVPTSFVIPVSGRPGAFVVGLGHDIRLMLWSDDVPPAVGDVLETVDTAPGQESHRLNDAKADPKGRLWAGSIGTRLGPGRFAPNAASLYSLSKGRGLRSHVTGVTISNGLAWSADGRLLYYIDTPTGNVDVFDFDLDAGEVANRRTVFDFTKNNVRGDPDGMTIDNEGKLWVACFQAEQIIRVDPSTGKLLQGVTVPGYKVTSLAFGGEHLEELYVTTAHLDASDADRERRPGAGALFRVSGLGAAGLPAYDVVL